MTMGSVCRLIISVKNKDYIKLNNGKFFLGGDITRHYLSDIEMAILIGQGF